MNIFSSVFNNLLYKPLFNLLILTYVYLPVSDFGLAIIILTILLRLVLYPIMGQSIKYQKILNEMQPKIKEIQKNNKDDQEKQAQEIMKLYSENKISPFSIFLPLLIQLPLLLALFQVFKNGLQIEEMSVLYSFVKNPGPINYLFLGFIELAQPSNVLAVVAAVFQFFQMKTMDTGKKDKSQKESKDTMAKFSEMSQKQMPYFFSIFTFMILLNLPAALGLYWITSSLFSIVQQLIILKRK